MTKDAYRAYLKTPHWRKMRERKFAQVGKACELCGSTKRVEVHHLTYKRLGREWLKDLRVLCRHHHEAAHGSARGRVRGMGRLAAPRVKTPSASKKKLASQNDELHERQVRTRALRAARA